MPRGERDDEVLIERLDEAHVDEGRVEALGDRLSGRDQGAEGEHREPALALAPQLRLANPKRGERGCGRRAPAAAELTALGGGKAQRRREAQSGLATPE